MYRVVVDTNVFVSGVIISNGPPSRIINHWRNQNFIMIASPQLIAEYEEVLLRPKIRKYTGLSRQEVKQYIEEVRGRVYLTSGKLKLDVLKIDPDENMILACAEEGMATHVVTGNSRHFPFVEYKGIHIVTPREFLSILEK